MTRASQHCEINASAERAFGVLTCYERYAEFLPEVTRADVLNADGHKKRVRFEIELFKVSLWYEVEMTEEPYRTVSWTLLDSNWLRSVDGRWTIESLSHGHCRITYHRDLKIKGLVSQALSTRLVTFALPEMMDHFKRRIESSV